MEYIVRLLETDLPAALRSAEQALLTKSLIVQLAVWAAVLIFMFPVGRIGIALFRRICRSMRLAEQLVVFCNFIRGLLLRPSLSEDAEAHIRAILVSLEVLFRPLSGYYLLQASILLLVWMQDTHAYFLERIAPFFLLWAAYRWSYALGSLFVHETMWKGLHKRLLRPLFGVLCILIAFKQLHSAILWFQKPLLQLGSAAISPKGFLLSILIVYACIKLSAKTKTFLQDGLLPQFNVTPALNNTLATFVSYMLIGLGLFLAISTLGFTGSSLTVLFGALTVGIGFGLQSIINNFVSGLILLAEQSIAPGDVIEMDGKICTVEHIRIRSTTVRTYDNVELRLPNSRLLGDIVQSYTGRDTKNRTHIRVGVSYQSDPKTVQTLLLQACKNVESILSTPAPVVQFADFGKDALLFDIHVWVEHPHHIPGVMSQLRFQVWYILKDAGVEMPFPQRELHLSTELTTNLAHFLSAKQACNPATHMHSTAHMTPLSGSRGSSRIHTDFPVPNSSIVPHMSDSVEGTEESAIDAASFSSAEWSMGLPSIFTLHNSPSNPTSFTHPYVPRALETELEREDTPLFVEDDEKPLHDPIRSSSSTLSSETIEKDAVTTDEGENKEEGES